MPKDTKVKSTALVSQPAKKNPSTNTGPPPPIKPYATGSRSSKARPPKATTQKILSIYADPQLDLIEQKARSCNLARFRYNQEGFFIFFAPPSNEFQRFWPENTKRGTGDSGNVIPMDSKGQDNSGPRQTLSIDIEGLISPMVFNAKLRTTKHGPELVVKHAHDDDEYNKLLKEFGVYHRLIQEAGFKEFIPDVIGCYTLEKSPELRHATLVMKNCGTSLARLGGGVSIKDRISCIRALRALHNAGYVHGSLNARKILRDIDSGIKFVGFSETVECHNSEAKEAEYQGLLSILNGISKGHVEHLKELERERRGAGTTSEVRDCSMLFGPVVPVVRNGKILDINMERLLIWASDSFPPSTECFAIQRVEKDFLYVSNLTKEEAKQFYFDWLSSYPLGFDVIPIHTFPDYTLCR